MKKKNKSGFTLIELLIVVAIIAILAAIAIPNFLAAQVRSKVSRVKTELRTINTGLEAYNVDNNMYPPERIDMQILGIWTQSERTFFAQTALTTPVAYITSIPMDIFKRSNEWQPPAYHYYNWLERNKAMTNAHILWYWPDYYDVEAAGLIMSLGPSQTVPSDRGVYDPSNGTVSLGYIARLFPGGEGSR